MKKKLREKKNKKSFDFFYVLNYIALICTSSDDLDKIKIGKSSS